MNQTASGKKQNQTSALAGILSKMEPIELPKPKLNRRKSVFAALQKRKTVRSISNHPLSRQMLSSLLWSACGVNRKKGPFGIPGRTAASASNSQEIDVYVAMRSGVFRYEPTSHCLIPIVSEDLRELAIGQGQGRAGANAPVRLVYVVDIDKFSKAGFQEPGLWDAETQKAYYHVDTGLIAGNVYLFAAAHGLAAWFHNCNRKELHRKLGLTDRKRALFGQTIGYAEKEPARA